jgi:hypothetical protein
LAHIDAHVFFWPGTAKGPVASGQNHFKRYEKEHPLLLRVPTQSLLAVNPDVTLLFCPFNSGAPRTVGGRKSPRGPGTFLPAHQFQKPPSGVVEVVVNGPVRLPRDAAKAHKYNGSWTVLF